VSDVAYARAGETHVAYRVVGEPGRVDLVMVASALFPFDLLAEDRVASRFTAALPAWVVSPCSTSVVSGCPIR
jgi:hypothetical protein